MPDSHLELLQRVSPAVARVVARHPDLLGVPLVDAATLRTEAVAVAEEAEDEAAMQRALRRIKYRVVAALIQQDFDEGPPAAEFVTARLSDLADGLCAGAVAFADRRLARRHGRPPAWPDGGGFVVVALGKHGGGDLNYSSDIDVIIVTGDVREMTAGDKPIPSTTYAERLAAQFSRLLNDPTEDGFCFRVDLDLRPDGVAGPPTTSLRSAEQYYLTWARTWERAAWLKARPCAGDLELGAELLAVLEPFRFRRSMDFGTLEDLAVLRDRIASTARRTPSERDLKRGRGGIRSLEFFIQALQLVWAGREARLRVRGTMPALRALAEAEVLPEGVEVAPLEAAWSLLRAVEHRLQWPEEAQTQRLPGDDEGWDRLAACFTGPLADRGQLQAAIEAARDTVEASWAGLKLRPEREGSAPDPVDPFASTAERVQTLHGLGFRDPGDASRRIGNLALAGGARARMTGAGWRAYERLMPELLGRVGASGDPDTALARLEAFVSRAGARRTTYSLLDDNPAVAGALVRLFAHSAYLSDLLVEHPELLDALVLRGRGGERPPGTVDQLDAELRADLEPRTDLDDALLALRTNQTAELLRIGMADLGDELPGDGLPNRWLSHLARAIVRAAAGLATRGMSERHGLLPEAASVAVLGFGSAGSGWMTYGSDLDLGFVYDASQATSDGRRPLDAGRWATRWSQRIVTALSAQTREGRCYEVDLRMRPDGNKGPVVATLAGFSAYYRTRARPFETLALCRASVLSAPDALRGRLEAALVRARHAPDRGPILVAEAREMRQRQMELLGPDRPGVHPLKRGRGGLLDLEFALACGQATRRAGHPALQAADPLVVLDAVTPELLSAREADVAREAWTSLRRVEASLRLRSGRGADSLVIPSDDGDRVASELGLSGDALDAQMADDRQALGGIAAELLTRVERGGCAPAPGR